MAYFKSWRLFILRCLLLQDDSGEGLNGGVLGKVLAGIGYSALAASLIWLRSPSSQALQEILPPPQVMQQVSPASLEMKVDASYSRIPPLHACQD